MAAKGNTPVSRAERPATGTLRKYGRDELDDLIGRHSAALEQVIASREQVNQEMRRSLATQSVINDLLHLSYLDKTLDEILEAALARILAVDWITSDPRGAIFLQAGSQLIRRAQFGAESTACASLKRGECNCGRAAASGKMVISDCVEERHHFITRDATPHGVCCVPLTRQDQVLGVLVVYLKVGQSANAVERSFLKAVASTLATIVDHVRTTQRMLQAEKLASLGQLVAGVAHEINNPNSFIAMNVPVLRAYWDAIVGELDRRSAEESAYQILGMPYRSFREDVPKLLDDMEYGSERISNIVGQLKSYVRAESDRARGRHSLAEVVDHAMTLVGGQLSKYVKQVTVDVGEDLPPLWINSKRIEQVLMNLLVNGAQATDKTDSRLAISARPDADVPGFMNIRVLDNGCGIPPNIRRRIFDPFFTTKGEQQGTGLGLALSRRVVEDHGGQIEVESEVGRGTRVTLRLPIAPEDNP